MSELYRHRDGGLYQVIEIAKASWDNSDQVVYRHLWPFEPSVWVRPSKEFYDGRFQQISVDDVIEAKHADRLSAQNRVIEAKRLRKL